jgi:hypothetical protein
LGSYTANLLTMGVMKKQQKIVGQHEEKLNRYEGRY